MAKTYDIDDHTPEVKRLISEAIEQGLEKIGIAAEGYAKLKCPTSPHGGRLKNSITHAVSMQDEAVYIGTDVKYAA